MGILLPGGGPGGGGPGGGGANFGAGTSSLNFLGIDTSYYLEHYNLKSHTKMIMARFSKCLYSY